MIDLFSIFSKGGIVLWWFQGTNQILTPSVNALIKSVFLQERVSRSEFQHNGITMKFKLDNEFELIFLVAYQNIVQLSYIDKLISDVQREFRDRYKNVLEDSQGLYALCGSKEDYFGQFSQEFKDILREAEIAGRAAPPQKMRTFEQSLKSQKTIASMIEKPAGPAIPETKGAKDSKKSGIPVSSKSGSRKENGRSTSPPTVENGGFTMTNGTVDTKFGGGDIAGQDEIQKNREAFFNRMNKGGVKPSVKPTKKPAEGGKGGKKGKAARVWGPGGPEPEVLDYSEPKPDEANGEADTLEDNEYREQQRQFVGKMSGELEGIQYESDSDDLPDDVEEEEEEKDLYEAKRTTRAQAANKASGGGFGVFSAFKSLVGSKCLTLEDIQPALDKMKDHLIGKNVAADIADKLCSSVASKLEGKVIGTFSGVAGTVKSTLSDALVQLLSPQRRVDILRDVMEAQRQKRPYVVVFCGVNGVGKSTNLAKVTFWLNENGYRVLIAACDTFRSGAVEQLRTHSRHLNHLHPQHVHLYEQGYGKDAASIAQHAVSYASENAFDVVLVDTAGRMQDNEPLMRALAKLVHVNSPDLVLFVGEALVGNEAVDQLTKFNQALADHSAPGKQARLIDGIVLTKFDTIDDKVGAAISMTYITGQPIVFVGTGQTYNDLKNLNPNAVVHALLK